MESVLLKLEIRISGKRGKLNDFLKNVGVHESKKDSMKAIHSIAFVKDETDFSKIYTEPNRDLIDWIRKNKPESVYSMAKNMGKDLSNLSKTLRTLADFSLVRLEEGRSVRRTLTPIVDWDRLEVLFPAKEKVSSKKKAA